VRPDVLPALHATLPPKGGLGVIVTSLCGAIVFQLPIEGILHLTVGYAALHFSTPRLAQPSGSF